MNKLQRDDTEHDTDYYLASEADARIAGLEAECARLRAEVAALRAALKRYADGRCVTNLHTRQVARAIEKEADAALRGKETP